MSAPTTEDITKQELDELDLLLQHMLSMSLTHMEEPDVRKTIAMATASTPLPPNRTVVSTRPLTSSPINNNPNSGNPNGINPVYSFPSAPSIPVPVNSAISTSTSTVNSSAGPSSVAIPGNSSSANHPSVQNSGNSNSPVRANQSNLTTITVSSKSIAGMNSNSAVSGAERTGQTNNGSLSNGSLSTAGSLPSFQYPNTSNIPETTEGIGVSTQYSNGEIGSSQGNTQGSTQEDPAIKYERLNSPLARFDEIGTNSRKTATNNLTSGVPENSPAHLNPSPSSSSSPPPTNIVQPGILAGSTGSPSANPITMVFGNPPPSNQIMPVFPLPENPPTPATTNFSSAPMSPLPPAYTSSQNLPPLPVTSPLFKQALSGNSSEQEKSVQSGLFSKEAVDFHRQNASAQPTPNFAATNAGYEIEGANKVSSPIGAINSPVSSSIQNPNSNLQNSNSNFQTLSIPNSQSLSAPNPVQITIENPQTMTKTEQKYPHSPLKFWQMPFAFVDEIYNFATSLLGPLTNWLSKRWVKNCLGRIGFLLILASLVLAGLFVAGIDLPF